jgi:hypothetical protein
MLNPKKVKELSDANETACKEWFEKLGYEVKKLDRDNKNRRPDFLVSKSPRPQMLCEAKTVASAGYVPATGAHISTLDPAPSKFHLKLTRIDDKLSEAVIQRDTLVEDDSSFADLPLLVALFFDPWAELPRHHLGLRVESDERFREISGILESKADTFVLVKNKAAIRPVPEDFERLCLCDA